METKASAIIAPPPIPCIDLPASIASMPGANPLMKQPDAVKQRRCRQRPRKPEGEGRKRRARPCNDATDFVERRQPGDVGLAADVAHDRRGDGRNHQLVRRMQPHAEGEQRMVEKWPDL